MLADEGLVVLETNLVVVDVAATVLEAWDAAGDEAAELDAAAADTDVEEEVATGAFVANRVVVTVVDC